MDLRKRFQEIIASIPKEAVIAILHDTDADGICSAVIMAKAMNKLGYNPFFLHDANNRASLTKKNIMLIKKKKVSFLFTTDKAIDTDTATIQQLEKLCTIVVFDHHHFENNITSSKTLLIKPQLFSKIPASKYPASKLVYDFFGEVTDVEDCDWLCAAGIISDASYFQWQDFVDSVHKRHNIQIQKVVFSSELARVGQSITTATLFDEKIISKVVKIVYTAENYKDILQQLKQYVFPVRQEINKSLAEFQQKTEYYEDSTLYWYELDSKFPVSSIVSTRLSMNNPSATFIVAEKRSKFIGLSLRRQDGKINCVDLVKTAISGIKNAAGGGHIPAAGCQVPYKEKEKVKKKIIDYLRHKLV